MVSSGLLCRVALVRTDVSEEPGASFIRVIRIGELGKHKLQLATDERCVRRLLVAACVVPSAPIFVTLMKEGPGSSESSVLTSATRRNNPEDTIVHSSRKALSSYKRIQNLKDGRQWPHTARELVPPVFTTTKQRSLWFQPNQFTDGYVRTASRWQRYRRRVLSNYVCTTYRRANTGSRLEIEPNDGVTVNVPSFQCRQNLSCQHHSTGRMEVCHAQP
jgi:hypothetical protein